MTDLENHRKLETKCLAKKQTNSQGSTLEMLKELEIRAPLKIDSCEMDSKL